MKTLSFIFGFVGGFLNVAFALAITIAGFAAEHTPFGLLGLFLIFVALFLLNRAFRARDDERAGNAIWIIVCSALSGLVYTAFLILVLSNNPRGEDVFFALTGAICAFITLAGGIMAIITRKEKYLLYGNLKSNGSNSNKVMKVMAIVFGFIGASVNILFAITGFIELTHMFSSLSDGFEYIPVLFFIMLMLISLTGAVILLFNRLLGGLLLITSSVLVLLLSSISLVASVDTSGAILIISQLLVLAGGILGIIGFKSGALTVPASS